MPQIKTRDVLKGTVKAIDKSAVAAQRMKDAYVRVKDNAEHSYESAESSPEEYPMTAFPRFPIRRSMRPGTSWTGRAERRSRKQRTISPKPRSISSSKRQSSQSGRHGNRQSRRPAQSEKRRNRPQVGSSKGRTSPSGHAGKALFPSASLPAPGEMPQ